MTVLGVAWRAAAVFAGTSLIALIVGALIAPWSPRADLGPLHPERFVPSGGSADAGTVRTEVSVQRRDGTTASGWLVAPRDGSPTTAAIVIGGAGSSTRDHFLPLAEAWAGHGVAVLVTDKRVAGYSAVSRDFDLLARDAEDAAMAMRARLGAATRVIAIGVSEGGWIAPRITASTPGLLSALILVSPSVVSPLSQTIWMADNALSQAPPIVRRVAAAALAGGRAFLDYVDEDSSAALGATTTPIYAVWSAGDATVPVASAILELERTARGPVTVTILRGNRHVPGSSEWVADAAAWTSSLPASAVRVVRGEEPASSHAAPAPPPAAWYLDPRAHLALSLTATVIFVAACVRHARRGRRS